MKVKKGRGRKLTFSEAQICAIRNMANRGMRAKVISQIIGRHYKGVWQLMKRLGIKGQGRWVFPSLDKNPSWRGGRYVDDEGYVHVRCPSHPYTHGKGYVLEHRLVMEKQIGRYLLRSEVVHHKDKNRSNNAIENLQLFDSNGLHLNHELSGKVPRWTPEGLIRIRDGSRKGTRISSLRS